MQWCIGPEAIRQEQSSTICLILPLAVRSTCQPRSHKLFYKRECQEKYSPAELEAGENRLAFSPLYRLMAASVVRRVTYPEGLHQFAFGRFAGFTPSLFLLSGCVRQNGPEQSRARRQARR
jgi:hypothetical protein